MSTYPDTATLVGLSSEPALTDLAASEQDALRLAAIRAIEEFCGQPFETVVETVVIDGYGSDRVYLPKRLHELTAIKINGTDWPTGSVNVSPGGDALTRNREAGLGYYAQAMAEVTRERFPTGLDNVEVTGTWGHEPIPDNVTQAVVWDMEDAAIADASLLSDTIRTYRRLGIENIQQGNLNASFGGAPMLSERVAQLLRPHVWVGRVGALV